MASKRQKKGAGGAVRGNNEDPPRGGGLKRFVVTVVVLLVILWVTCFFALRTPVGQDALCARIASRLDMDCELGAASLRFPLTVRVVDVRLLERGADRRVCLKIKQVDFGWFGGGTLRALLMVPELVLQQDGKGKWTPASLGWLGDVQEGGARPVADAVRSIGPRFRVEVQEGNVQWYDVEGERRCEVRNIHFRSWPVKIPGRTLRYCELEYRRTLKDAEATESTNEVAWFSTEDVAFIALPPSELNAETP